MKIHKQGEISLVFHLHFPKQEGYFFITVKSKGV